MQHFSFLFTPFLEDFSAAQPFLLRQVNNHLDHNFLSQQSTRIFLFLSEPMSLFLAGRDQSAAELPGWRSSPIVTIMCLCACLSLRACVCSCVRVSLRVRTTTQEGW